MKALFFFVLTCWYMPCAAYTVTVHIREQKTERPMEFADVALYRAADSVLVAGSVADSEGCFAFGSVAAGRYYVKDGFMGYETRCSPAFAVGKQRVADLGTFYLCRSSGRLEKVVVEARRPTYVQRIDKRVFYVGEDLMSVSGSVSDLMRDIPSVQVDVEGNWPEYWLPGSTLP